MDFGQRAVEAEVRGLRSGRHLMESGVLGSELLPPRGYPFGRVLTQTPEIAARQAADPVPVRRHGEQFRHARVVVLADPVAVCWS